MEITRYRRSFQKRFNQLHHITPKTIVKGVSQKEGINRGTKHLPKSDIKRQVIELDAQMREAAERLDFERAIQLRDAIAELNKALSRKMENEALTPEN
jgi:excinuclease ABC subunit B